MPFQASIGYHALLILIGIGKAQVTIFGRIGDSYVVSESNTSVEEIPDVVFGRCKRSRLFIFPLLNHFTIHSRAPALTESIVVTTSVTSSVSVSVFSFFTTTVLILIVGKLKNRLKGSRGVNRYAKSFSALPILGFDQNHSVRGTSPVKRCCRWPFQHVNGLNVIGIDKASRIPEIDGSRTIQAVTRSIQAIGDRHTIHEEQGLIVPSERVRAANRDIGGGTWAS